MSGRPPLRIGTHGKIRRIDLGDGMWLARCRYRDSDGETRIIERRAEDKYGKAAEDELLAALAARRTPSTGDITADTKLAALVTLYIDKLEPRRAATTIDTYRVTARKMGKIAGSIRVGEATPAKMDDALQSMRTAHGAGMARHARAVLRGALQLAVKAEALDFNPVRDVSDIESTTPTKGAPALKVEQVRNILGQLQESEYCQRHDLVDPITMLVATGLRRSELLGLRWQDFSAKDKTIKVAGKVARITGKGLQRFDATKTDAGTRTLPLPAFAVLMLEKRRRVPFVGQQAVIFASTSGTLRDPNNFGRDWRRVRDSLGLPDVTSHSFRKTLATLIDADGLSARIGADHLGHARISMTQDNYMARNRVHPEVADVLDRAVSDE